MFTRESWELPLLPHQPSGYDAGAHVSVSTSAQDRGVTEAAPPYRGEGPNALWHVSDDDSIRRFEPHHRPGHSLDEPLVWAVDTRHLPLYWFPRECPRATFWATSGTTDDDVVRFLRGERTRRVHVVEPAWLDALRTTRVVAYRLPEETFERWDRFWVSRSGVAPLERVELGDLVKRHDEAKIELRTDDDLLASWDAVVASTLDFSGIRLRNASMAT
jgi:hypothetical protein